MAKYVVLLALDDNGKGWEPGLWLHVFPADYAFNPGDVASFYPVQIETEIPIEELKAHRLKKVLPLDQFMSGAEKAEWLIQKANVQDRVNGQGQELEHEDLGKKLDKNRTHKLNKLTMNDSSIILMPPGIVIPNDKEKEKFG